MKILLGSGRKVDEGYVRVDSNNKLNPDVCHDLLVYPWPFGDSSAKEIKAFHVVEHLIKDGDIESFNNFFREAWRVLEHWGLLLISVPSYKHAGAYSDPTHISIWSKNKFAFVSKKCIQGNIDRGTSMSDVKIDYDFDLMHLEDNGEEIHAALRAVKE